MEKDMNTKDTTPIAVPTETHEEIRQEAFDRKISQGQLVKDAWDARQSTGKNLAIHDATLVDRIGFKNSYRLYPDGNMWCCVDSEFVNLQESTAGFGQSPNDAMTDYFNNGGI